MTPAERDGKRRILLGMLGMLSLIEHSAGQGAARAEAIGMPVGMAKALGLIPDTVKQIAQDVTAEGALEYLRLVESVMPMVEKQAKREAEKFGQEIAMIDLPKTRDPAMEAAFGCVADRIMDLLASDADKVDAMLRSVGLANEVEGT